MEEEAIPDKLALIKCWISSKSWIPYQYKVFSPTVYEPSAFSKYQTTTQKMCKQDCFKKRIYLDSHRPSQ